MRSRGRVAGPFESIRKTRRRWPAGPRRHGGSGEPDTTLSRDHKEGDAQSTVVSPLSCRRLFSGQCVLSMRHHRANSVHKKETAVRRLVRAAHESTLARRPAEALAISEMGRATARDARRRHAYSPALAGRVADPIGDITLDALADEIAALLQRAVGLTPVENTSATQEFSAAIRVGFQVSHWSRRRTKDGAGPGNRLGRL